MGDIRARCMSVGKMKNPEKRGHLRQVLKREGTTLMGLALDKSTEDLL